jgi:putative oxidoreductase
MNSLRIARATHIALRLVAGLMFMQHGQQKLFGWYGGIVGAPDARVALLSQMGLAGVLECLGGAALMLGLLTRPVAFLLCGEMAVAYFTAHQPHGAWPIENHGELAVLYCFVLLFMAGNGSGGFSLDALMHRRRTQPHIVSVVPLPRDVVAHS